ncbi:hypothetical protein EYF80_007908 [Liparis tanakae]|uniref:Uncharacterized protein n=1 Tax=Liparis tanakae TaxID=230148 RepID=A0A4Z2IUU6_9TELE|nr:hypothetical protein EYF80_007908 [Liparis tanakae]
MVRPTLGWQLGGVPPIAQAQQTSAPPYAQRGVATALSFDDCSRLILGGSARPSPPSLPPGVLGGSFRPVR